VLIRGFNTLSGAKIPHAASLSPSFGYSGVFQEPVTGRSLFRTPSDCRPHLAASPRTNRLPSVIGPSTGLALPTQVSRAEARGATPYRTALHRDIGCSVCDPPLGVASLRRVAATGLAHTPIQPSRAGPDIQSSYLSPSLSAEDPLRGNLRTRGSPLRAGD